MDYLWLIILISIGAVLAIAVGINLRNKTKNNVEKVIDETNLLPLVADVKIGVKIPIING